MNNAGFGYTNSPKNRFRLPNSSSDLNKTTLEGLRYLFNENFKLGEDYIEEVQGLISRSATFRKTKYRNNTYLSKNYLDNSDFNLWSAGTIFTFANSNVPQAISDSWKVNPNGSTGAVSRKTFIPLNQTAVPEFPNHFLSLAVSNYVGNVSISQVLANPEQFSGQSITLSGYFSAKENGIILVPKVKISYGTSGTFADTVLTGSTVVIGLQFSRFSATFSIPSDVASKVSSGAYLECFFEVQEQGIYEVQASSCQLEIGTVATPYKANENIVSEVLYLVDTSLNPLTLKCSATPSAGDTFAVLDYAGTFDLQNFTIDANGKNILGNSSLVLSEKSTLLMFNYINDTLGWILLMRSSLSLVDSGNSRVSLTQSLVHSLIL